MITGQDTMEALQQHFQYMVHFSVFSKYSNIWMIFYSLLHRSFYLIKYLASASRQATNIPFIFSVFLVIDCNKRNKKKKEDQDKVEKDPETHLNVNLL